MLKATTLTEVIEGNRAFRRSITYLEGEDDAREVSFGELYERALGILYHLQRIGARRGDKLILFLGNNEQFIDAFWAAILGGIVPCRWRWASATSTVTSCCASHAASASRFCTPSAARSSASAPSRRRRARLQCSRGCVSAPSWWTTSTTSRAPAACSARSPTTRLHPVLLRLHQRAQGRGAHARQHHRQLARCD